MANSVNTQEKAILALVNDLYFAAKIGDTAKYLGHRIEFTGSGADFFDKLACTRPALIIADLTIGGVHIAAVLSQLEGGPQQAAVPVLGYTTHADWKRTGPLHDKCTKVVTNDTLSRSLPDLIRQMINQRLAGEP
jgi:hypothetical protein